MASLNFVKGSIRGRVGQFVGSSWRGKDYIKTYTPPGNPRTEGQVVIRTIFQHTAHIAKAIYEPVLKPYTFPKPQKMTAYNKMIQINKELFTHLEWAPLKLKIFDGPLYNPGISSAKIEGIGIDMSVRVEWNHEHGESTDTAICVVHDEVSEKTFYAITTRALGTAAVLLDLPGQEDLPGLHAYLVFSKPPVHGDIENAEPDIPGEVSDTTCMTVNLTAAEDSRYTEPDSEGA